MATSSRVRSQVRSKSQLIPLLFAVVGSIASAALVVPTTTAHAARWAEYAQFGDECQPPGAKATDWYGHELTCELQFGGSKGDGPFGYYWH
jgi:hypothetical protein